MNVLKTLWRDNPVACTLMIIAGLVVLRIGLVIATPLEIGPDEAQYWRWSRTLDLGYYSKPPLVAWVIAISTAVFGDSEWAIRILSPVLHGVGAIFLFFLGRKAFDNRIGAWAAAIYLLMPGIFLSSTIMSTDAVLLPISAAALYLLWRFRETPSYRNAILAGACIGLAMLAKYAALYIYGGVALAALIDRDTRKALLSPAGGALVVASLVVLGPNLYWNVANGFATVGHTADNANLAGAGFNPLNITSFFLDQLAVSGPITFPLLLTGFFAIVGRKDKWTSSREFWLICFVAPPLLIIMTQEILSRAHANWAASAYPGACVLIASWIDRVFDRPTGRLKAGPFVKASVALNAFIGLIFCVLWVLPSLADMTGASNAMKGVRGWKETVAQVSQRASEVGVSAILVDDRELWHGIDYYGRNVVLPPVRQWQRGPAPHSHAEQAGALQPGDDARLLIVSSNEGLRTIIREDFKSIAEIGYITIPLGPTRERKLKLYLASGYQQAERTPEFEAAHAEQSEP